MKKENFIFLVKKENLEKLIYIWIKVKFLILKIILVFNQWHFMIIIN